MEMEKDFYINDIINWGWQVTSRYIGFFIAIIALSFLANLAPNILQPVMVEIVEEIPFFILPMVGLWIVGFVIGIIINIGLIRIALNFCDQVKPLIATLFNGLDCFWRFLGTTLLYGLIVMIGLLVFILPGIYLAIMFQHSLYFVVDKGLGPIKALSASARNTRNVRLILLGFNILCIFINLAGALLLMVGLLFTIPLTMLAQALVYRHLTVQTSDLAELGVNIQPPLPQQGPIYYDQPIGSDPYRDMDETI